MRERVIRLFLSSPSDARIERRRVEEIAGRLNSEFSGVARLEAISWEEAFYRARNTLQAQIPEAAECDIVIAVFRARLGSPLPDDFPRMRSGEPYPSRTAYEVLTAMEAARARGGKPEVGVFRCSTPPTVSLASLERAEVEKQWKQLMGFFDAWFRSDFGGYGVASYQTFSDVDDFTEKVEDWLRRLLKSYGIETVRPEPFLFVSHVAEDSAAALSIVEELERRGVPCWIAPRDIQPGRPYDDEIANAIDACRAMLLIFSERCNDSAYIRRELTVAGEVGKPILPLRIDNAQPKRGLRLRLNDLHWIDAFANREIAINQLMRVLGGKASFHSGSRD